MIIDGPQYCLWSRAVFEDMRAGGVTAVHVTVTYHEDFRGLIQQLADWNRRFIDHADLIVPARSAADIDAAKASGRTAIVFGIQNPLPIESDLGLVEILATLGIRFMQLTYNNQSLLGSGWQEPRDGGITRFGREVITEMNRLGLVIDLSHAGERTTLEAIEISARPVTVSHANPSWWRETNRNVSKAVIQALGRRTGMLGFSLYPHHLKNGSACTLSEFCAMVREVADLIGTEHIGLGSDLCQGQPDSVVQWMRIGRWTFPPPGSADAVATFPAQPDWFGGNRDFQKIAAGLADAKFGDREIGDIMGGNWYRFMAASFATMPAPATERTAS